MKKEVIVAIIIAVGLVLAGCMVKLGLSSIADRDRFVTVKGLSEREIRICVLVLIGFSYAEIAQILFRAESGIGKDKYTIAKHLGVSVKQLRETLLSIAFNHA